MKIRVNKIQKIMNILYIKIEKKTRGRFRFRRIDRYFAIPRVILKLISVNIEALNINASTKTMDVEV